MHNWIDSMLGTFAVIIISAFIFAGFVKSHQKCTCEKCFCQCGCPCCLTEGCCQVKGGCCELCTCCESCGKTECNCK